MSTNISTYEKRECEVYRISCGYFLYNDQKVCYPDSKLRYESKIAYYDAKELCIENGVMTKDDMLDWMLEQDLWNADKEKQVEDIPNILNDLKIDLFNTMIKFKSGKDIREKINRLKDRFEELTEERHYYDSYTAEGIAGYIQSIFIMESAVDDFADINNLLHSYYCTILNDDELREIAKTEPWKTIWAAQDNCKGLFNNYAIDLTIEQQRLIMWSKLYDNIAESPECPPDFIVNDDNALDGWLLVQQRKRQREQHQSAKEDLLSGSKNRNADEVFLPVKSKEEADAIYGLNSGSSNMVRKQRMNQIKQQGNVKSKQFPDIKRKLKMKATQAYRDRVKKKG